ncbi:MAG: hypothetical protein P8Y66_05005 [Nitrospirota bacterium]|jgi:hypothetical protein
MMLQPDERIYFLECTSYSENNPQGYDDLPVFHRDVWPLIENNIDSIETIYIFPPHEEEPEVIEKEIIKNLYREQLRWRNVKHRSYYGGHLDVYFRTSDLSFISRLISLWRQPCPLMNTVEDLKIEDYKIIFLRNITKEMDESYVLFGFGHDGDPLYLFGQVNTLATIADEKRRGSQVDGLDNPTAKGGDFFE